MATKLQPQKKLKQETKSKQKTQVRAKKTASKAATPSRWPYLIRNLQIGSGWLACSGLLLAAVFGLWTLYQQPVHQYVITTEVDAAEQTQLEQAFADAKLSNSQSFLDGPYKKMVRLQQRLQEIRWVQTVAVRRRWPNQVEIQLERAVPIARWGVDEYITATGELVEMAAEQSHLPAFQVALASPEAAMKAYIEIQQLLRPLQLSVQALQQNPQGEWRTTLDTGEQIYIGKQNIRQRMERLVRVYAAAHADHERIESFDLRYTSGVAVQPVVDPTVMVAGLDGGAK
ncbi:MAG: cell division protein FtsQ/DivIB [Pseudomonadota bacterium]